MKNRFSWASLVALAMVWNSEANTSAATNGIILVSTRAPQDTTFSSEYTTDEKGPGMASPGDVAMVSALADYGYSCRLILDKLLGGGGPVLGLPDAAVFLTPSNPEMEIKLAIMSGSGASADTPPPPPGVPVMMGEHVCLGNNSERPGSLYLYNGTASSDPNSGTAPAATRYMKVVNPDHPIMKGIPLDELGRVKIFREPYPEENAHVPVGGKPNYEYRWCTQVAADKAEGTTILGVLDGAEDRACFAVFEAGGLDARGEVINNRMVHLFMNENGSGGSRRVFLALTEIGRILFVRSVKWALGEELAPYQSFRILEVAPEGAQRIKVSWQGSAMNNYRIIGSTDWRNWSTVVDDIPGGVDGMRSRTLNISAAPPTLFMRLVSLP